MFIRAATGTAPRELAVNDDGGHAAHAVLLRFRSYLGLAHITNDYLMRGTGYPL